MSVLGLTALALAACARSEDASLVVDTNAIKGVEQVRTPEQDDEDLAIGEWRDALRGGASMLEFGTSAETPLFSLGCDERNGLNLQRHGIAVAGSVPMMLVSIGSQSRRLAVASTRAPDPLLRATLPPSDALIAALETASTPISVRIGDALPIVLPPSPSIPAFLARCRNRGPAVDDPGNLAAPADISAEPTNAAVPAR